MSKASKKVSSKLNLRTFLKLLEKKANQKIILRTLGRKKQVIFYRETRPRVICENSKGNRCDISRLFRKVLAQYKGLKRKGEYTSKGHPKYLAASNYVPMQWRNSPDRNFAPYIAAAISYLDKKLS
jgi:hypothetical protein